MDMMTLIDYAITQGPWAVTFVCLLFYVMKESKAREERQERVNREREGKLHELIDKLSEKYDVIIEEVRDLKDVFNSNNKK